MRHYNEYITHAARDYRINKFVVRFSVPVGNGRMITEEAAHHQPLQARELAYARIAAILANPAREYASYVLLTQSPQGLAA